MRHKSLPIIIALTAFSGCTVPDVGDQLKATSASFTELKTATRSSLEAKSRKEILSERKRLIHAKEPVIKLVGLCQGLGAIETVKLQVPNCNLASEVDVVSGEINASQLLAYENALDVYLESLVALLDAESTNEVKSQIANLLLSIKGLDTKEFDEKLALLAEKAVDDKDRIIHAVGYIVKQARHNAVRKAVRRANSAIQSASPTIYRYYERQNPALTNIAVRLNDAQIRMIEARQNGTAAQYEDAIVAVEETYKQFQDLQKSDPSYWYAKFSHTHQALHDYLKSGGTSSDLIIALDDLIAFKP